MGRVRCTLTTADGTARRVDTIGLVIGREPDCDIVVADPQISRRHALVRIDADGCELVVLGRTPVAWNGTPCDRSQRLANGDKLQLGNVTFVVGIERDAAGGAAPAFQLVVRDGASYGLTQTPFAIGGGEGDDLRLAAWPDHAIALHLVEGELFVEPRVAGVRLGGVELPCDGELAPLSAGDTLAHGGAEISIAHGPDRAATTIVSTSAPAGPPLPVKVVVEMLPRGGRVVFSMPSGDHCVYLADRRLDLIAALLRPPAGYRPGDYIPDDVLRPLVWPGNPNVIRSEINVHITRCRRDLVAGGLPGPRLIERAPGGGATRLALAENCEVTFL